MYMRCLLISTSTLVGPLAFGFAFGAFVAGGVVRAGAVFTGGFVPVVLGAVVGGRVVGAVVASVVAAVVGVVTPTATVELVFVATVGDVGAGATVVGVVATAVAGAAVVAVVAGALVSGAGGTTNGGGVGVGAIVDEGVGIVACASVINEKIVSVLTPRSSAAIPFLRRGDRNDEDCIDSVISK
jgi:hypothetical protein